ncbi:glutathione reductase [Cunninghamella echinulata]|nr:glutathione reductase [Cunninghamella echinulata]
MAPVIEPKQVEYDLIVIGGGSGGISSARRAASYGAKVAIIEKHSVLGGTCVNVGCVPKKVMWNTASIQEAIHHSASYGFEGPKPTFNWNVLKHKRDAYVKRLNGIYDNNVTKDEIEWFHGLGSFIDQHTIQVELANNGGKIQLKTKKVLIAVGGYPIIPSEDSIPGASLGIHSDGFFELEHQPKNVVVIGTGYIGIELAGIFHALGTNVTVVSRTKHILRTFDEIIRETLLQEMQKVGVNFAFDAKVTELVKNESDGSITVHYESSGEKKSLKTDTVLWAIGRAPHVDLLNLDNVNIQLDEKKQIKVDAYQKTSEDNIFAVGDVTGHYELTPVAIAAGRRLMDRLFGGEKFKNSKLEYENIPTVVFSHPTAGTVGLTEEQAKEKYGQDNIKVYKSRFVNLYYGLLDHKEPSAYKIIVTGPEERVVGLHLLGKGSDEILQGFGVCLRFGATKADFDNCVAIHPTAAEELVTMR